jgi:hypothetical protein
MTDADQPRQRDSIFSLGRQLVSGMVQLARLEVTRGRQEIGQMVDEAKSGVILIAIAVALVVLALIAFVDFIILGLAALLSFLPAWLWALILFVVLVAVAGLLGWRGVKRIKFGAPEETIGAVKEDIEWAKRLLRRG